MPNDLNGFDFKANPFMDIINQQSNQSQGQPPQGNGTMGAGTNGTSMGGGNTTGQMGGGSQGGMMGGEMEQEESQYTKGQNPDRAKPLVTAIQALENYITQSTERDEILTARGIISLITRLVAKDQEVMMKE